MNRWNAYWIHGISQAFIASKQAINSKNYEICEQPLSTYVKIGDKKKTIKQMITYGQVPDRLRCGTAATCSSVTWSADDNSSQLKPFSIEYDVATHNCPLLSTWSFDVFKQLLCAVFPLYWITLANDNIDIFNSEFHGFFDLSQFEQIWSWYDRCIPFVFVGHFSDVRHVFVLFILFVRRFNHECLYGICPVVLVVYIVVRSISCIWSFGSMFLDQLNRPLVTFPIIRFTFILVAVLAFYPKSTWTTLFLFCNVNILIH